CAPREDVENELRAVDDLALEPGLNVTQLRRTQLRIEDHETDCGLSARCGELVELPASEVRRRIWTRALLRETQRDPRAGSLRQPRELIERSFRLELAVGTAGDQTDDGGAFLRGGSYRGHQPDEPSRTKGQHECPARHVSTHVNSLHQLC